MNHIRIEFKNEWSPRKLRMMQQELEGMMARAGCPNISWEVLSKGEPKTPLFLHIGCSHCAASFQSQAKPYRGWIAEKFEACALHGRSGMMKIQSQRIPLPKGMGVGQNVARDMGIVKPPPPPPPANDEEIDPQIGELLKERGFGEPGHLNVQPVVEARIEE